MTRKTLPMRRPSETFETEWQGHKLTITLGYHPKTGRVLEVFADTAHGGQMQETIRDACVMISIALQCGYDPALLPKSMGRVPDYTGAEDYASPIGKIAEIVAMAA